MEIETTRDIARQILRHRSFSFQEFSQRYANVTELGTTLSKPRMQDTKNRQASIENSDEALAYQWDYMQMQALQACQEVYAFAIEKGIAKEVARKVMPEGLTNTRMYMNGSLRSWLHYCEVRRDPSTQSDHRDIAEKVAEVLKVAFPEISEIL